ncbi:MAG TPA: VOC family protein [Candidatus Binatia bacterium]|nr:VOC family protein [Candidatus Binatia bacterium]
MELNQVTVPCTDLAASVAFYERLGLVLIVHDPPRYARFECPPANATFSLHLTDRPPDGRGPVVYFEIGDLDAHVDRLRAAGVVFESGPQDQSWLWREAYVRDPAGNLVCLYHAGSNRRFPPWRLGG